MISLNNYGSENTQYITKEYLMGLLEKPFQSIPELIKYTHFNKDYPENQNIKLTNKKEPFVKVLKNNKWELADRKDTINDLIDQKHSILNMVDIKNSFEANIVNRIENFNYKYLNDDKELINKLYKDSELVLLNNSCATTTISLGTAWHKWYKHWLFSNYGLAQMYSACATLFVFLKTFLPKYSTIHYKSYYETS